MGSAPASTSYNINFEADLGELNSLQSMFAGANNELEEMQRELSGLVSALSSTEGAMSFISRSVASFSRFNEHVARTGALANASAEELTILTKTAADLGRTTEFTAANVAKGMSNLALAGFRVEEIVSAMPGLLATATAGTVELNNAANISAQILRSFHLEAGQMNYVAGALTATFTSTNTTLQELSYTMQYAGADAHELGVSLSELAAAGGILGNVGLKGSIAGTGLREFIARLGATLAENKNQIGNAKEALKQLGITWREVSDEAGNLNLVKAVGALESAFDRMGMKAEERLKSLRPIFGARAGTQVTALVSQGAEILAAKDMEVAFGGAKQQLDALLQSAARLPEGMHGIVVSSKEIAENFVKIGSQGRGNLARITGQMRDLGMVGGFLNTQVGITRDIISKINGQVIKRQVFVPMQELGTSTLRTIDALHRLRQRLKEVGSESERLVILHDLFGADPRIFEQATRAMNEGGQAMAEFANNIIRATSALDVQKKQLNTVRGSMELMRSAFEGMRIQLGAVAAPIARIMAMALAGIAQLISGEVTLMGLFADFQDNLGGIEAQLVEMTGAFKELSIAGKAFALVLVGAILTPLLALSGLMSGVIVSATAAAGTVGSSVSIGLTLYAVLAGIINALIAISPRLIGFGNLILAVMGKASSEFRDFEAQFIGLQLIFAHMPSTIAGIGAAFRGLGWAAFIEALTYTAYDLIPAILKGFSDMAARIASFGEFSMAGLGAGGATIGEFQMAMPDGGVLNSFVENLEFVIDGIIMGLEFLLHSVTRIVDAVNQMLLSLASFVMALIINLLNYIPRALFTLYNAVLALLGRIITSLISVLAGLILGGLRNIVGVIFLFFNTIYEIVKTQILSLLDTLQIIIVDAPGMLINGMLRAIAFFTNILGHISTIMIQIGTRIIANTINWTAYVLNTIVRITQYVIMLPVVLPYLFYRAFVLIFDVASNRLRTGSEGIANVVRGIISRLREIAAEFLNSLMTGIVRLIQDNYNLIINVLKGYLNIPVMIFKVATAVYNSISYALGYIYSGIVGWLDALPYTIAGYIGSAWGMILNVLSSIISFFGDIISFIGRLVIVLVTTVFKIFTGLVTELPFLILRIVVHAFTSFVSGMLSTIHILIAQVKGIVFGLIANFHIHFTTQITRVFSIIKDGIPQLMKTLSATAKASIKDFANLVESIVYDLPEWFASSIVTLATWLQQEILTLPMKVVTGTLSALTIASQTIIRVIGNIILGVERVSTTGMSSVQSRVVGAAVRFLMDFPGLMIQAIARAWSVFMNGMRALVKSITDIDWDDASERIRKALQNLLAKLTVVFYTIRDTLVAIAKGGAASFIAALRNWLGFGLGEIPEKLKNKFAEIWVDIKEFGDGLKTTLKDVWKSLSEIDWWAYIIDASEEMYACIERDLTRIRNWLTTLPTDGVWGSIRQGITGIVTIVQSAINIARPLLATIRARWSDLMTAMYTGLTGGVAYGMKFITGGLYVLGGVLIVLGRLARAAFEAVAILGGVFGDMSQDIAAGNFTGIASRIIDAIIAVSQGDYDKLAQPLSNAFEYIMDIVADLIWRAFFGMYHGILKNFSGHFPLLGAIARAAGFMFYMLGVVLVGLIQIADKAIYGTLSLIIEFVVGLIGLLGDLLNAAYAAGAAITAFLVGITNIPQYFRDLGNDIYNAIFGSSKPTAPPGPLGSGMGGGAGAGNGVLPGTGTGSGLGSGPGPSYIPPRGTGAGSRGSGALAFADGAIVQRATKAVVGDAGPEAIMPLSVMAGMLQSAFSPIFDLITTAAETLNVQKQNKTMQEQVLSALQENKQSVEKMALSIDSGFKDISNRFTTTNLALAGIATAIVVTTSIETVVKSLLAVTIAMAAGRLAKSLTAELGTALGTAATTLQGVPAAGAAAAAGAATQNAGIILRGVPIPASGMSALPAPAAAAKASLLLTETAGMTKWQIFKNSLINGFNSLFKVVSRFLTPILSFLAPIALVVAKFALLVAIAYVVVGVITKFIEALTGWDLGGFWGPLKAILTLPETLREGLSKIPIIGGYFAKTPDKEKPEGGGSGLPAQASTLDPVQQAQYLQDLFRTAMPEDALQQLQSMYASQAKELIEAEDAMMMDPTDEAASVRYQDAAIKLKGINIAIGKMFNGANASATYGMNAEQRADLFNRSAGNFQPVYNYSVHIQANNEDPAKIATIMRDSFDMQTNRGNVNLPASRGGNDKHPGTNQSPVVHSSQPPVKTHRK